MNINKEVDAYLAKKAHPLTEEIDAVRKIVLGTDNNVEECIKWSSPTFTYKGNMASFFMNAKKHVSLMFHKGAFINDPSGLLTGDGKEGRVAKFSDMDDINNRKEDLQAVVREWIRMMDEG